MADPLTDFLLARIAEDETVARAAMQRGLLPGDGPARWRDDDRSEAPGQNPGHSVVWNGVGQAVVSHAYHHQGAHIARHDPARVIAECEAKRWALSAWADFGGGWTDTQAEAAFETRRHYFNRLAAIYADHPDYRDEWRP